MSLEAPDHAVNDLLAALAEALGDDANTERLDELGDRADEIVSTTDLSDLVAAIGLGGDDQPQSLPAAVAAGDPEEVAALRSLLTAAKLPTADEEQREQLVDELESLAETAQPQPPDESESTEAENETEAESTENEDEGETESTETAPEAEAEEEAESAETANDTDEAESEDTGSVRQLLESQLQDTFDIFDDGLDVKGLTDGLTDDEDETEAETETDDSEPSEETADEKDQSTQSRDGTRWRPGGRGRTTHSTIPTTGRRDIGHSGRYSSIRGSTVSKR